MFGFLKKKEPIPEPERDPDPQWANFRKYDYCSDCELLGDPLFEDCCPNCGSEEFAQVIARWEYISVKTTKGTIFSSYRKQNRYEIKT